MKQSGAREKLIIIFKTGIPGKGLILKQDDVKQEYSLAFPVSSLLSSTVAVLYWVLKLSLLLGKPLLPSYELLDYINILLEYFQ